jgi:hypothetical protein
MLLPALGLAWSYLAARSITQTVITGRGINADVALIFAEIQGFLRYYMIPVLAVALLMATINFGYCIFRPRSQTAPGEA